MVQEDVGRFALGHGAVEDDQLFAQGGFLLVRSRSGQPRSCADMRVSLFSFVAGVVAHPCADAFEQAPSDLPSVRTTSMSALYS